MHYVIAVKRLGRTRNSTLQFNLEQETPKVRI